MNEKQWFSFAIEDWTYYSDIEKSDTNPDYDYYAETEAIISESETRENQITNDHSYDNEIDKTYSEIDEEIRLEAKASNSDATPTIESNYYIDKKSPIRLKGIRLETLGDLCAKWLRARRNISDIKDEMLYKKHRKEIQDHMGIFSKNYYGAFAVTKNPKKQIQNVIENAYRIFIGEKTVSNERDITNDGMCVLIVPEIINDIMKECVEVDKKFIEILNKIGTENKHELDMFESDLKEFGIIIPHGYQYVQYVNAIKAAEYCIPMFIHGETGTGKESMAAIIHKKSGREGKFIPINCAAIPENLIESELFGHVKGAFTGATSTREGKLCEADKGTLFLDEIGDIPYSVQVKLLRALQEKEVIPVGGTTKDSKKVDILLVSATHKDPQKLVESGILREDFYYRVLNCLHVYLRPLRSLGQRNLLKTADYMLRDIYRKEAERRKTCDEIKFVKMSVPFQKHLLKHTWPGNFRELRNYLHIVAAMSRFEPLIKRTDLPFMRYNVNSSDSKSGKIEDIGNMIFKEICNKKYSYKKLLSEIEPIIISRLMHFCKDYKNGKMELAEMLGRNYTDKKLTELWKNGINSNSTHSSIVTNETVDIQKPCRNEDSGILLDEYETEESIDDKTNDDLPF